MQIKTKVKELKLHYVELHITPGKNFLRVKKRIAQHSYRFFFFLVTSVERQGTLSKKLIKCKEIYQPMSSALKAIGRLFVHNNLLASTCMSIAFVSSAISGASGNAAANS